mmetsp:Transcript_25440/g.40487  ORF Transcript_25440/g.40487 Transcript_25440/m.40487 type:complete len:215 (+) Transcript_25440:471-1115(+)
MSPSKFIDERWFTDRPHEINAFQIAKLVLVHPDVHNELIEDTLQRSDSDPARYHTDARIVMQPLRNLEFTIWSFHKTEQFRPVEVDLLVSLHEFLKSLSPITQHSNMNLYILHMTRRRGGDAVWMELGQSNGRNANEHVLSARVSESLFVELQFDDIAIQQSHIRHSHGIQHHDDTTKEEIHHKYHRCPGNSVVNEVSMNQTFVWSTIRAIMNV